MRRIAEGTAIIIMLAGRLPAQQPRMIDAKSSVVLDPAKSHLSRIDWIALGRDGTIAVSQPDEHAVKFFSSDGSPGAAIGKVGDGTGEFTRLGNAGWLGDTLWINDPSLHRLTLISPQQKVLRTISTGIDVILASGDPAPLPAAAAPGSPTPMAIYPDGSLLLYSFIPNNASVPTAWNRPALSSALYVHVAGNGLVRDMTGWVPSSTTACAKRIGTSSVGLPLCPAVARAEAPDGHVVAFAVPSISGTDSGSIRIVELGPRGDTLLARRYPFKPMVVPPAVADSVMTAALGYVRNPQMADSLRTYHPTIYPPVSGILLGRDGSLWIEERATDARLWLVIDPRGTVVGMVSVPTTARIRAVEGRIAWATVRDDQGDGVIRFEIPQ